ncbi:MAG TPA: hypothetical protein VK934_12700 [Fimbriimonas sp.]|nr:hypothetical protein [Fimbriimonas sp.]
MRRRFGPYNPEVINEELRKLPTRDAIDLKTAMKQYQDDTGVGYRIKNYGDGLMMISDSGRGQGRCLFFRAETNINPKTGEVEERLTALLVYKKETQKVPQSVIQTARKRMGET